MRPGALREFFSRTTKVPHADAAGLLKQSEQGLQNWVKRHGPRAAPKVARERGKGRERVKQLYDTDALTVFAFGNLLRDFGIETNIAITLGISIYKDLRRHVISPMLEGQATENQLRDRLQNLVALIWKIPGRKHQVTIIDGRELASNPHYADPSVFTFRCGLTLIYLAEAVSALAEMSKAA